MSGWVETPFPLSNGLNVWIRYPRAAVPTEDVERLAEFICALLGGRPDEQDVPYADYPGEHGKETPWGKRVDV